MQLVIVESPSKAKTIEKYLGSDYTVRASVGHVRDLPKSNKKAIDIEGGFIPHYEVSKGKEHVISELQTLAKKADKIYLATDPDREGEAIAWHISEALDLASKKSNKEHPTKRVVFHEITKDAVTEAMKHPRDIDMRLKEAQEARRVLDRLVGYDLSGVIWKKVRYGLSAGRVQSPALRIIMEREREIRAFVSEKYWSITALTKTSINEEISMTADTEPRDEKLVEKILSTAKKSDWIVDSVTETEVKRAPKAPFTTSTLQQTASTRLGFAPSRTMQVAQKLYEAGHITYMRTDSTNLATVAVASAHATIENEFGKGMVEARTFKTKSKNAQEAHEAIRPTNFALKSAGHNEEQKKLYQLIRERTLASQMIDALTLRTKISVKISDEKDIPAFSANGSRVLSEGWLQADPRARGEDVELPKVSKGDKLKLVNIEALEKQTEPMGRYTEAGLIKELEKRGIGRPSTYASIIKTLDDRGYVEKVQRALVPTATGEVVSDFLEQHFAEYISDTFTAEMEDKLDDIANGERAYEKTLKDFYVPFLKDVKSKDKLEKATNMGDAPAEFPCPVCGSAMVYKLSRGGKFMSCSRFPECNGARTLEGNILEGPKKLGRECPKCGKGELWQREGRFGMFIACSLYPKCKYIEEDPEEIAKKDSGVKCPVCNDGSMIERRGRFGIFYSCSNYPTCKNAIKAKPTGNICPMCQSLMMEGTKTIPERCSNKLCPNHNPHKLASAENKEEKTKK